MRKFLILFIAIILPLIVSCQGNIDIEKEEAAIKAVIEKETNAARRYGYDSWASLIEARESCFVQDESFVVIGAGKNGHTYIKGWDQAAYDPSVRDSLINVAPPPEPADSKTEYTNYQIKVYPECAWAVYDEDRYSSEGEHLVHFDCVRFLEKIDGEWRINFLSYINTTSYEVVEAEAEAEAEAEETE